MLNNKTIAVVVPAYNEETQIGMVIETMPDFVDRIVVVNDCSKDKTADIVKNYWDGPLNVGIHLNRIDQNYIKTRHNKAQEILKQLIIDEQMKCPAFITENKDVSSERVVLLTHKTNSGKGAGIVTGYKWCKDFGIDCIATMDGDGQMDPDELESICSPIIYENVDYVKGNRLIHRSALLVIPKVRYLGNAILSILTKIASGYWHVSDTQTGFTAIGKKALHAIRVHEIYRGYGYPNDMLIKLNIAFCSIKEVEIKPVYDIGEKSKMKLHKVIPHISWLLFKSFFKRLWTKYLFRDFHPLFILYHLSFILFAIWIPYLFKMIRIIVSGLSASTETLFAFTFLGVTAVQFLLFAMWMDIQDNERLYKN